MNVVIVEDEEPAVRVLRSHLASLDPSIAVIAELDSVTSAVEWFSRNPAPDFGLFDIQLSDGLSFEIFEAVHIPCPIIFTTAYDEYAVRAFKVNSIDYLLKPIALEDLRNAITKMRMRLAPERTQTPAADLAALAQYLRAEQKTYRARFLIPFQERFLTVQIEDILYFYSANKQTYLVTRDMKRLPLERTLELLEDELDPKQFFRANRQYIIRTDVIGSIHTFFNGKLKVHLRGSNEEITISKEKAGEFKAWLDR